MTSRPATELTAETWARLGPYIDAALDLEADQRPAYLERACAGDPQMRAQLEQLLADCERNDTLIDRAAAERFALLLEEGRELPRVLGDRFTVEREIGSGGMATVYLGHDRKHDSTLR